ncbi:MAG: TrpB-like pyridoxal phosphate-dependent enzyme [Candidatus Micrarchaeia archaeon]
MKYNKIILDENELPKYYYNILPDLPEALPPPINPQTKEPISPKDLEIIFPKELIRQEMSKEPRIKIPDEIKEVLLKMGRPSPLIRAKYLEKYLKTPAKIYFKHEGLNPCGSHKPNTAIAQAYYNQKEGTETLSTETGAGQWGTALSYSCNFFGLKCEVFMVRISFDRKPHRKIMMQTYGADVYPSPSSKTEFGKAYLKKNPNTPGSLGIAISEAIEVAIKNENTKYSLGSVLNHVMLHQTVIGLEVKKQLEIAQETPDILIGCVGGGSNFAGFSFPFMKDKLKGNSNARFIAVEPSTCPTLTKGDYRYDHGDTAGLTPLLKMYTLGKDFIPPPIYAGGLRYHGMSPIISLLAKYNFVEPEAYPQKEVFDSARIFVRTEGIIPAPESAHAIHSAIKHAIICKEKNEKKTIVFNLSGHGLLDLGAYESI